MGELLILVPRPYSVASPYPVGLTGVCDSVTQHREVVRLVLDLFVYYTSDLASHL